jgi:hypothetical protein
MLAFPDVPAERLRLAVLLSLPPVTMCLNAVAEYIDAGEAAALEDVAASLRFHE